LEATLTPFSLPITVFIFRLRMLSSKLYRKGAIKRRVPYGLVFKRYWRTLIGTCGAWYGRSPHTRATLIHKNRFLYDFVTFPNGVFSGTIISSVVHNADIKSTAEWQLLLSTIALPGVFVGAWVLCERIGRRNTMIVGFSGYLVFGLIIGLAYERITKVRSGPICGEQRLTNSRSSRSSSFCECCSCLP
jgi:hypothetical protein